MWAILVLGSTLMLCRCVTQKADPGVNRTSEIDVQGVWNGTTVNDCSPVQFEPSRCGAIERISFTMLPLNEKSWGFYSCAPGTTPCYDQVERGEISYLNLNGEMLWFRVMRDDHSSCLFDTVPSAARMSGKFWCFQGTAIIERGSWRVDRVY
jgi:hypothetical protein